MADWRAAVSAALFAIVLSRLLVVLAAAVAIAIAQQWGGPGGERRQPLASGRISGDRPATRRKPAAR